MWKGACSRVACLRIPEFPIVAARRLHAVPGELPLALIRGEGAHARVVEADLLNPAGSQVIGWTLSRARALIHGLVVLSWDAALEERLHLESRKVRQALEVLSPRCSSGGVGVFWTEPFVPRGDKAGEDGYGARLLQSIADLGFIGGRVGIADGIIAAAAATRQSDMDCYRVEPGDDAEFLSGLPLDVLPLSPRVQGLLGELGICTIRELQQLNPESLVARFGQEGERARRYAYGMDPRQPRAHLSSTVTRQEVLLDHPCVHLQSLLYVLRSAIEDLVCGLARQNQGITCLRLTLLHSDGEDSVVEVKPRKTASDGGSLMRLLERDLMETPPFPEGAAVEGMWVEACALSTRPVIQGDLFRGHLEAEGELERMVSRLTQRLGREALQLPRQRDAHHPDRQGFWIVVHTIEDEQVPEGKISTGLSACVRRLEVPRLLTRIDERRWQIKESAERVNILKWYGPEVLSGCWWSAPFERSTYWCLTEDRRVLWIYRNRLTDQWYLQGWLD